MRGGSVTVYRLRSDGLVWRSFDDEGVVLDLERSLYLGTNEAATLLWERLREGADHDQLVDVLASEFDVDREVASRDVDVYLDQLRQHGLLAE